MRTKMFFVKRNKNQNENYLQNENNTTYVRFLLRTKTRRYEREHVERVCGHCHKFISPAISESLVYTPHICPQSACGSYTAHFRVLQSTWFLKGN